MSGFIVVDRALPCRSASNWSLKTASNSPTPSCARRLTTAAWIFTQTIKKRPRLPARCSRERSSFGVTWSAPITSRQSRSPPSVTGSYLFGACTGTLASFSFDHLVGDGEHARRNGQPERLGRFHVDDQVELGRLHNRKIARLITLENPPSVDPNLMIGIHNAWSVAHQATSHSVFGIWIDRR